MNIKNIIIYLLEWLIPSSTLVYIVASVNILWGNITVYDYTLNLPAYLIACVAGAIIFYPVNKYIFKHECKTITITVNGVKQIVKEGDEIKW